VTVALLAVEIGREREGPSEVEQARVEIRGRAARLRPEEEQARHVLVDLGLELELERRHRALLARAPGEVDEMAHALDGEEEIAEVRVVEALARVVGGEVGEHALVEEEGELDLALMLGDEELLAGRASQTRRERSSRQLIDDEVAHVELGSD